MWADSSVAAARLLLVATLLLLAADATSAFAPAAGAAPAPSLRMAASGRSSRTNSSMSSSGGVGGGASNDEQGMMDRIRRGLGPSRQHESRQPLRGSHRRGPFSSAGERAGAAPTRAIARSGSPGCLRISSDEHDDDSDDDKDTRLPGSRSSHGKAFAAAACFRGGAASPGSRSSSSSSSSSSNGGSGNEDSTGIRPVIAAAVQSVNAGGTPRKNRLIIDYVEDALATMWSYMAVVGVPVLHLGRLGFGLSLLFYGMAFRTFAFHVIVFRIAGMKQVQRAVRELVGKYASARRSIREAAEAAETVGERVVQGDDLQAARERMIEEKKRLLSDGFLSERDTTYFMKKYRAELLKIKEEQELFQSARSSVLSLRSSVGPRQARSSFNGVYNALIACFTASTIQTAGQFTLGLHIGNLLKTHVLDLFGPIIDPIGYRLDLSPYFDEEDIPYMGKANAMGGPRNMALNILCYSVVFAVFRVHPSVALKLSMVYYGGRVVTDYVVLFTEPARRKLGQMTIVHTPWSAVIHAGLTILGYYCHRSVLYTAEIPGLNPLAVGPGAVGLVEPVVRFAVKISEILSDIEFFRCKFVEDPVQMVKHMTGRRKVSVGPVEFLKTLLSRGE